uniref:Uncharacterized protein n=1 Tax=Oryza sativa subsp. japonica TaxID=39947 RepID=Q651Y9_ORYSJ|nr:hypothetical protein [Oryza sativa Japonica Group]
MSTIAAACPVLPFFALLFSSLLFSSLLLSGQPETAAGGRGFWAARCGRQPHGRGRGQRGRGRRSGGRQPHCCGARVAVSRRRNGSRQWAGLRLYSEPPPPNPPTMKGRS